MTRYVLTMEIDVLDPPRLLAYARAKLISEGIEDYDADTLNEAQALLCVIDSAPVDGGWLDIGAEVWSSACEEVMR